ncbi:ImmA/IrrE family metallo-endopeptidase [Niabella sp. CC-SYL272]|uniref:ImmA/IrrE family metallo-endopeptidase n=1 Tax=Niabella agricola TaxID=2891571 RepID=UPI001F3CB7BD|nr:ImmA/IrrE family metallo-endopeptidase [Niabella agricola]MCF3107378.1 ImmA/IrrE family metallo-endopeptidase [Niabella agricola]
MDSLNINSLLKSVFEDRPVPNIKALFDSKLEEYGIAKTKALKLLSIDKDVFEEIVTGTAKQPNLIHVVKLAEFLEIDINSFIKVVLNNQSVDNIASIDSARKTTFLLKNFDVKTLTKLGFFQSNDNLDALVKKVLTFFGFSSIQDFEEQLEEPLYSRTKRNFSDKMKDFWIKSAYQTFKVINNPNDYDRNRLKDLIVKIKPYSQDVDNGLFIVCRALYNVGVTVIFQDYLSTTQVRGGTFIINGKPCIVLTDFNKKYPTIWFTLLHELHHVLFDFEFIETNRFHLTGDDDLFLIEEKANSFARDFFLPEEKFQYIKKYIHNPYLVSKFARENEVHESIVYSFYIWYQDELYGKKYHAAFKEFLPAYSNSLKKLNPVSWDEESIKVTSERIKEILEIK